MAKGSAMGLWRGRKGNNVFYKITNSNNAQKQGIRERVYEVRNPNTEAQIDQRIKMTPVSNVYNALSKVLRRAWQGVDYGGRGYQEFMKDALRLKHGIPYLVKGDKRPVPGLFLISSGSIAPVACTIPTSGDDSESLINTSLNVAGLTTTQPPSWNEYMSVLKANNDIQEGDQVSVIICETPALSTAITGTERYFKWRVVSFYVQDVEEGITPQENPFGGFYLSQVSGQLAIVPLNLNDEYENIKIVAGAVVISRLNGNRYERSTARLAVSNLTIADFFTSYAYEQAKASYRTSEGTSSSNWQYDNATRAAESETDNATYQSLHEVVVISTQNYEYKVALGNFSDGSIRPLYARGTNYSIMAYGGTEASPAPFYYRPATGEVAAGDVVSCETNAANLQLAVREGATVAKWMPIDAVLFTRN